MTPREKTVEKWGTPLHPIWAKWIDPGFMKGVNISTPVARSTRKPRILRS